MSNQIGPVGCCLINNNSVESVIPVIVRVGEDSYKNELLTGDVYIRSTSGQYYSTGIFVISDGDRSVFKEKVHEIRQRLIDNQYVEGFLLKEDDLTQ